MELAKQKEFDFETALKEPVPQVTFNAFEIDNIDPLTLLLQTGYVTIKGTEEPPERGPEGPVVSREHLPQLENIQEVLPCRRDEAHFL